MNLTKTSKSLLMAITLVFCISIFLAQEIINNNKPLKVKQSIKKLTYYFENFNDSSNSFEVDGIKVDKITNNKENVIVDLTGSENTMIRTATNSNAYNSLIKTNAVGLDGIVMLAKSTVTPKYAKSKVLPPERGDIFNLGSLK